MSVNNCCPYQGELLRKALPPLITTEFLLGIFGNGMALWIFGWHMRPWKSSTVLLFNLALADFFLNMVLPFRAGYYLFGMDWRFGDIFCRIFLLLVSLNRNGSIAFLTFIALDRYMRVVHPHHWLNSISVAKTAAFAMVVWVITILLNIHLLTSPQHLKVGPTLQCESFVVCLSENPNSIWYKFVFMASFFIPLTLILVCSLSIISELRRRHLDHHSKIRKAFYSLVVVVVVFVICFLPSNVAQALIWVKVWSQRTCKAMEVVNAVFYFTLTLTYLNSMLDPVVYYFSSPVFQQVCKRLAGLQSKEDTGDTGQDGSKGKNSQTA